MKFVIVGYSTANLFDKLNKLATNISFSGTIGDVLCPQNGDELHGVSVGTWPSGSTIVHGLIDTEVWHLVRPPIDWRRDSGSFLVRMTVIPGISSAPDMMPHHLME